MTHGPVVGQAMPCIHRNFTKHINLADIALCQPMPVRPSVLRDALEAATAIEDLSCRAGTLSEFQPG